MVVIGGELEDLDGKPLGAVGTVAGAILEYTYYRICWPVSGDETARLYQRETLPKQDEDRRHIAGGRWPQDAGEYCDCAAGVACFECGEA